MADTSKYEITIVPKATYVEDQSDPSKDQYVFAYTITISNTGNIPAQLISRHWIITDANGKVLEVKGLGVVGQQPLLKPGESFEYRFVVPDAGTFWYHSHQLSHEQVQHVDGTGVAVGARRLAIRFAHANGHERVVACAAVGARLNVQGSETGRAQQARAMLVGERLRREGGGNGGDSHGVHPPDSAPWAGANARAHGCCRD